MSLISRLTAAFQAIGSDVKTRPTHEEMLAAIDNARPRIYKQLDTVDRSYSTSWADGFITNRVTIRDGWAVGLHYELPCRNNYTNWGGGYAELQYSVNGSNWRSFATSGTQLAMGRSAGIIRTDTRSFLLMRSQLKAPAEGDFTIQFKMRHRSYQGTLFINKSRGTAAAEFASLFIINETKFQ